MTNRDDAPPAAAVDLMWADGCYPDSREACAENLALLRTLPDADAWALIAWIAAGREPTREMVEAQPDSASTYAPTYRKALLRAMLAAAKETRDGS